MVGTVKVFICYKKLLSRSKGGQIVVQENLRAGLLNSLLNQSSGTFQSWIDEAELPAGMAWEAEIYRQILDSDVLLLLVAPGTADSQWVRREIALAKALGISMVPIGTAITQEEITHEMKELDISQLQWRITNNITHTGQRALLEEIGPSLVAAAERTMAEQQNVVNRLIARRRIESPKAKDDQRYATFRFPHGERTINLHVAAGDLGKVRDIDVIVNSENDYMQMARFFESRTISSMLRSRGSRVRNNRYEDTIQAELDWQLRDRGRPVQAGEVFPTSAGGPTSELSTTNRVRYIFHVAAVQALVTRGVVEPFGEPDQIESCVRACLKTFGNINSAEGIISPPETEQHTEQKQRETSGEGKVRSILFPLFGTGQGGKSCADVIGPMLDGLLGYFDHAKVSDPIGTLTDVYLSVYREQDVQIVMEHIGTRMQRSP
jgi:hypothetical protein